MLEFKISNLNHPFAQAIKAYVSYFNFPAAVRPDDGSLGEGSVPIHLIEANAVDAKVMRQVEDLVGDKHRLVLLVVPDAREGPFQVVLAEMPEVFQVDPSVSAGKFVDLLRKLVSDVGQNTDYYLNYMKAESFLTIGDVDQATAAVKGLVKVDGKQFSSRMLYARCLFAGNKLEPALKQAQAAAKMKPKSLSARSLVAAIYQKQGKSDKAEVELEKCLELAETSIKYLVQLGDVYFDQGKIEKSKEAYSSAIALDSDTPRASEGLLAVSIFEGDLKMANASIAAKGAGFDLARFCNSKAVSLTANRQFTAAEKMYLNTLGMLSGSDQAHKILFNLGLCLKKAGNLEKAKSYFEKCKQSAPPGFDRVDEQLKRL